MSNEIKNKKIIAELEIRIGIKVYKIEIGSKIRWIWIIGIIFLKLLYHFWTVQI